MSYSILDFKIASLETGKVYPQVQRMKKGYDFDSPFSIDQLALYRKQLPDFTPDLDYFILESGALPTDILSNAITSIGLLVSEKFKNVVADYILPPAIFYPAKIFHKDVFLDGYFWLQMISDYSEFVDYSKSQFVIVKNYGAEIDEIKISSFGDYEIKRTELKKESQALSIWAKKIVLPKSFDKMDLIHISRFSSDYFVSSNLYQHLLSSQLTGFDIRASEILTIDKE